MFLFLQKLDPKALIIFATLNLFFISWKKSRMQKAWRPIDLQRLSSLNSTERTLLK